MTICFNYKVIIKRERLVKLKLKDKIVIITGGTSGIGLACAKEFINEGSHVIISSHGDGNDIAASLGEHCKFIRCDVAKEEDVKNLIIQTIELFGRLDIMVANAGIGESSLLADEDFDEWNKIVSVNLSGVFLCNKYAIKEMLKNKKGSIINMSSILGIIANPLAPAYSACKSGVINLTKAAALAYSKEGIRVNAISPAYIKTPLIESIPEETLIPLHPIGRLGEDFEVAKAVTFLASDDASFITGINLPVDGGYTAQ